MKRLHRRKDIQTHCDYRTKSQIVKVYDVVRGAIAACEFYQTLFNQTSTDSRIVHAKSDPLDWAEGGV